jgi:hypothetical protein
VSRYRVGDIGHNVKGYGAVGNGSADDTAAIQAAIDAAGAGTTICPKATYKIASGLTIGTDGAILDLGGSTLDFTGTGIAIDVGTAATRQRVTIRNGLIQVAASQTGIRLFRSLNCRVENVRLRLDGPGTAILLDGNAVQNFFNYLEQIEISNTDTTAPYQGTGIAIKNEGNHNTIMRGVIQYVDTGILLDKTTGASVSGNLVQSVIVQNFTTYGIRQASAGTGNAFINNWFENVGGVGTGISLADTTTVAAFLLGNTYAGLATNVEDLSDNTANRQTMQFDLDRQRFGNLIAEFQTATGSRIKAERWSRAAPSEQVLELRGSEVKLNGGGTQGMRVAGGGAIVINGTTVWFSEDLDTNLYRSAADTLKTDDRFIAVGGVDTRVVLTASLPAAGASMDGHVLIEDAGAGDRNLIIYAGGQRFRIDGGVAF